MQYVNSILSHESLFSVSQKLACLCGWADTQIHSSGKTYLIQQAHQAKHSCDYL